MGGLLDSLLFSVFSRCLPEEGPWGCDYSGGPSRRTVRIFMACNAAWGVPSACNALQHAETQGEVCFCCLLPTSIAGATLAPTVQLLPHTGDCIGPTELCRWADSEAACLAAKIGKQQLCEYGPKCSKHALSDTVSLPTRMEGP